MRIPSRQFTILALESIKRSRCYHDTLRISKRRRALPLTFKRRRLNWISTWSADDIMTHNGFWRPPSDDRYALFPVPVCVWLGGFFAAYLMQMCFVFGMRVIKTTHGSVFLAKLVACELKVGVNPQIRHQRVFTDRVSVSDRSKVLLSADKLIHSILQTAAWSPDLLSLLPFWPFQGKAFHFFLTSFFFCWMYAALKKVSVTPLTLGVSVLLVICQELCLGVLVARLRAAKPTVGSV